MQPIYVVLGPYRVYRNVTRGGEGRAVKKLEQGPDGPSPGKRRDGPGKEIFWQAYMHGQRTIFH